MSGEFNAVVGQQLAVTLQWGHACCFEQRENALRHGLHHAALALLHLSQLETHSGGLDAVDGELFMDAVIELGGLQQRLRWNTPGVQTGSAEGERAVWVLPLIDAGHAELVLCSADRSRIAGRAAADYDDVK